MITTTPLFALSEAANKVIEESAKNGYEVNYQKICKDSGKEGKELAKEVFEYYNTFFGAVSENVLAAQKKLLPRRNKIEIANYDILEGVYQSFYRVEDRNATNYTSHCD